MIVGLFAVLLAAPAIAQPTITPEMMIVFLDQDGDGSVGRNEFINVQRGRFAQFDVNANGFMNYREFYASLDKASARNGEQSFRAFDGDRDNRLSPNEFLTYHAWVFDNVLDKDRDGAWSLDEARALAPRR